MSLDIVRCRHCGSAGSIEFDMCQVCLFDYSREEERASLSRLPGRIDTVDRHSEALEKEESRVLLAS